MSPSLWHAGGHKDAEAALQIRGLRQLPVSGSLQFSTPSHSFPYHLDARYFPVARECFHLPVFEGMEAVVSQTQLYNTESQLEEREN